MKSKDKHTALCDNDDDSIASHSGYTKHLSAEQRHKLKAGLRAAVKYKAKVQLAHHIILLTPRYANVRFV
jgi:hypothetical protein